MSRIPIHIEKIKKSIKLNFIDNGKESNESVQFLITIEEKGQKWLKTHLCSYEDLVSFKKEIDNLLEQTSTAEKLHVTNEDGMKIDEHYKNDPLCQNCTYQLSRKCIECLFILQSPLERMLFLELSKSNIYFRTQHALNWKGEYISIEGKTYGDDVNNFKDVLTVVDFYIERNNQKLCIYTDGHTYHDRTEEQAQHDKRIDRKLQELGYVVLRYTGKDVRENCSKITEDIKRFL